MCAIIDGRLVQLDRIRKDTETLGSNEDAHGSLDRLSSRLKACGNLPDELTTCVSQYDVGANVTGQQGPMTASRSPSDCSYRTYTRPKRRSGSESSLTGSLQSTADMDSKATELDISDDPTLRALRDTISEVEKQSKINSDCGACWASLSQVLVACEVML